MAEQNIGITMDTAAHDKKCSPFSTKENALEVGLSRDEGVLVKSSGV